jgi:hypothetical protein
MGKQYQKMNDTIENYNGMEYLKTYNTETAEAAIKKWGKSARMFQKSIGDGKGSLFTIVRQNGKIVDITEDFAASF